MWLKEDGSCQNGHSAPNISNIYEAEPKKEVGGFINWFKNQTPGSQVIFAVAVVFLFLFVGALFAAMLNSSTEVNQQTEETQPVGSEEVEKPEVVVKTEKVKLEVTSPKDGETITTPNVEIIGTTERGAMVTINGSEVEADENTGEFKSTFNLQEGLNTIKVSASKSGKEFNEVSLQITRPKPEPVWRKVAEFSGSTNKTTDIFNIPTEAEESKITWSVKGGQMAAFSYFLYPKGEEMSYTDTNMVTGPASDSSKLYETGDFYFKVISANSTWTLIVESKY